MKLRLSLSNESSHDRLYSKTTTHVEGAELRNTVTTDFENNTVTIIQFSTYPITDRVNKRPYMPLIQSEVDEQRYALDGNASSPKDPQFDAFLHRQNSIFVNISN